MLKLTILIFGPNFHKSKFRSKTEKINTTIEFCIFELVQVPNFSLIWEIWFFGDKLPKKGYFYLKTGNMNITIELCKFKLAKVLNFWLYVLCMSESTFYSCLNIKELLAQNRREIWSLSDCNGTRSHNQLVRSEHSNIWPNWPFFGPYFHKSDF